MTTLSVLAIIPARGGSKGVPRKNLRLLAGKPLIAYAIEQASAAKTVTRVIVSTDDKEIGAIAKQFGAEVVWRPADISGDHASSEAALLHVVGHLEKTEAYTPDLLVFMQCTSPLTLAEDIDGAVQELMVKDADTSLTVAPFHYFLWGKSLTGGAVGINHDKKVRFLRQQREPQYRETGGVYVMRTWGFKKTQYRFFGKTVMHILPAERCLEIDDEADFQLAVKKIAEQNLGQRLRLLPDPVEALVLDFDGVFTDNKVIVFQDGSEAVQCDRSDGMWLSRLKQLSVSVLVLSSEMNPVVQARCDKLNIPCLHGVSDKASMLIKWLKKNKINAAHAVYLGNDINDLACLKIVGCSVAVRDAVPEVRSATRIMLNACGGYGAVREMAELIIRKIGEARND